MGNETAPARKLIFPKGTFIVFNNTCSGTEGNCFPIFMEGSLAETGLRSENDRLQQSTGINISEFYSLNPIKIKYPLSVSLL